MVKDPSAPANPCRISREMPVNQVVFSLQPIKEMNWKRTVMRISSERPYAVSPKRRGYAFHLKTRVSFRVKQK